MQSGTHSTSVSLFAACAVGFKRALRRPGLMLGFWLLSLATAILATLPVQSMLAERWGDRTVVLRLAHGAGDLLWTDLLFDENGTLSMVIAAVVGGLLLSTITKVLLSGGLVSALLRPGHPLYAAPGRFLPRAAETAFAMLKLELFGFVLLRLPLLLAVGGSLYLLGLSEQLGEATASVWVLRFGPIAVAGILLWSVETVTMTYARAFRLSQATQRSSSFSALRSALTLLFHSPAQIVTTLGLAVISVAGYALLLVGGRVLAARLDYRLLVLLAFAVRQACAIARVYLALGVTAAAAEVWHAQESQ